MIRTLPKLVFSDWKAIFDLPTINHHVYSITVKFNYEGIDPLFHNNLKRKMHDFKNRKK